MFTKNCFIQKCNKTLINKLIELGYKPIGNINYNTYGIYCHNGKFKTCSTNEQPSIKNKNFIQCYENENLFLAITALQDNADKNQWFIYDSRDCSVESRRQFFWFICEEDNIEDMMYYDCMFLSCHKATVEELIEHFNIKNNEE